MVKLENSNKQRFNALTIQVPLEPNLCFMWIEDVSCPMRLDRSVSHMLYSTATAISVTPY